MDDRESVVRALREMTETVRAMREDLRGDQEKVRLDRVELDDRLEILAAGQDVLAQYMGAVVRLLPAQPHMPLPAVPVVRPVRAT